MKNKKKFAVRNAWICKIEGRNVIPVFGDLFVEKGKITGIEKKKFKEYLKSEYKISRADYDAKGRLLTVPVVNFHEHLYSRLAKGLEIKGSTESFYEILNNLWWKLDRTLDEKMIEASALMGGVEAIKNGVTYIFEHHSSPENIKGSLSVIADAIENTGIRGVLSFEVSDRNGVTVAKNSIEENKDFFINRSSENIKAMLGLHASFTLSDDSLEEASEIIKDFDLGIHIHLCEDSVDRALSKEIANALPVKRLTKFNLLNAKSILAHGIYLTRKDYYLIDEYGSAIAYNPDSNLNNSVGLPGFSSVPESIPILMGTDGMHGNPAKSLKTVFLLIRAAGFSFEEAFSFIRKRYFDQINFVKRYFNDYPLLAKGDRADFVIWDYVPPTPLNKNNFWGHFVYGLLERKALTVVQKGEFLMKDELLLSVSEEKLNKEIYLQGERLVRKFNKMQ